MFVIDILRATTTMCAALDHGARAIIPVASTEEALRLAQTLGSADVLPRGREELRAHPGLPPGQQPAGDDRGRVRGQDARRHHHQRHQGAARRQGAAAVYVRPAPATSALAAERARETLEQDGDVLVVCAGRDGAFSLDDAYCAGRLVAAALGGREAARGLNDAALASLDLVRRYGDRLGAPAAAAAAPAAS